MRVIGGGDRLPDEVCRKRRVSTKKRAIECKGMAGAGKTEANKFNPDGNVAVIDKEAKGTAVKHMSPNTMVGMEAVETSLKGKGFAVIRGRNFTLEIKIGLEKEIHIY